MNPKMLKINFALLGSFVNRSAPEAIPQLLIGPLSNEV